LEASITRYEHYFALQLGLQAGKKVLDLGCGVGGPMRSIARLSGAQVTGINNNGYQVERGNRYNREHGLDGLCEVVKGDFMRLPFDDASFDAAYDFEALVHAPDLAGVAKEIARVLKPGGRFVASDWCITEHYREDDRTHRRVKLQIEEGNGLPDIPTASTWHNAFIEAGFRINSHQDLAQSGSPSTPWYLPLTHHEWSVRALRAHPVGRWATSALVRALEASKMAPSGASEVSEMLDVAGRALVEGGELGIFTPLFFMCAEKVTASRRAQS
ncbi:MAG: methyltransferase domain-containing protein, partial [Polyangiales bacterium]